MTDSKKPRPAKRMYRSKWISLYDAIIKCEKFGLDKLEAWASIKQAIIDNELDARGHADGVIAVLHPQWLSILSWEDEVVLDPEWDNAKRELPINLILWFRQEKRRQCSPPAPARIEWIEINEEQFAKVFKPTKEKLALDKSQPQKQRWADKKLRNAFIRKEMEKIIKQKRLTLDVAAKQIFEDNKMDLIASGISIPKGVRRAYYRK